MAEIEIILPTVQYGNVKAKFTPEEFGLSPTDQLVDPTALGVAVAVYLNLFAQGFKAGSQMDVSAPVAASQHDDMVKAHEILAKGLGGVTEIDEQDPEGPGEAPWNSTVDAKPKPWESGEAAPKAAVVSSEW